MPDDVFHPHPFGRPLVERERVERGQTTKQPHWSAKLKEKVELLEQKIALLERENSSLKSDLDIYQQDNVALRAQFNIAEGEEDDQSGERDGDEGGDDDPDDHGDGGDPDDEDSSVDEDAFDDIVNVQVKCRPMNLSAFFPVRLSWKCKSLKFMVFGKWKMNPCHIRFTHTSDIPIWEHLSFSQNNVKENSVLNMFLNIAGGASAKRPRGSDEKKDAGDDILAFEIAQPKVLATDSDVVKKALSMAKIDVKGWIKSIEPTKAEELLDIITEQNKNTHIKFLIKPYLPFIKEYAQLEDRWDCQTVQSEIRFRQPPKQGSEVHFRHPQNEGLKSISDTPFLTI